MFNRIARTALDSTRQADAQSGAWTTIVRGAITGCRTAAHHTLMITGITAIGALGIMFVKPDLTDHLKALSPFSTAVAQQSAVEPHQLANLMDAQPRSSEPVAADNRPAMATEPATTQTAQRVTEEDSKRVGTNRQQELVTKWLSKRYRVAADATNMLVSAAYLTAKEIKLDPLLILSVMAIESRFNPFAESPVGAQGLMQVMSKVHHDKFQDLGGVKAALNPVANIKVGSLILKDYVERGGSVEAGLKMYVGAAAFETDSGYGSKVLAEYQRLKEVATGKRVPISSAVASRAPQKVRDERTSEKSDTLTEADSTSADKPV